MLGAIVLFVVIFSLLILAHEAGHFLAAKKVGIKVDEFGLGFPPQIKSFKKHGTIYSLNWIPFGG
jgi:regulator of sigma E protease